jgi:hypothetical protein
LIHRKVLREILWGILLFLIYFSFNNIAILYSFNKIRHIFRRRRTHLRLFLLCNPLPFNSFYKTVFLNVASSFFSFLKRKWTLLFSFAINPTKLHKKLSNIYKIEIVLSFFRNYISRTTFAFVINFS